MSPTLKRASRMKVSLKGEPCNLEGCQKSPFPQYLVLGSQEWEPLDDPSLVNPN